MTRTLFSFLLVASCFALGDGAGPGSAYPARCGRQIEPDASDTEVFIVGDVPEDELIALSVAIAAARPDGAVLFDSPACSSANRSFLEACHARCVTPLGHFEAGVADLERRLGTKARAKPCWENRQPVGLWKALFPRAECVVVCPARSRPLLLQAAVLAGSIRALSGSIAASPMTLPRCNASWRIGKRGRFMPSEAPETRAGTAR